MRCNNILLRAASGCLWRGMSRQRLKMIQKKLKGILKYIVFFTSVNLMWWKDKKYVTFYVYFSRMQNVFISDVESFFRELFFFRKKTGFVSTFFVNVFSKVIDDNHSTHMISSFPFFIFRCNVNTHRQKFWQDTKWMRTEEDSFPISLLHARTILVALSFTNI